MGRKHGYVYFEADCVGMFVNPFINLNLENPSLQGMKQKPLKGLTKDTIKALENGNELFEAISQGKFDGIEEKFRPTLEVVSKTILKQRKRLGGDWSIALACFSRSQREMLRKILGPDLVFIVLNMTNECQMKRLAGRHGDGQGEEFTGYLTKMFEIYEPAENDEENAYNVKVTEDMTPDDVIQKVLEIVQNL